MHVFFVDTDRDRSGMIARAIESNCQGVTRERTFTTITNGVTEAIYLIQKLRAQMDPLEPDLDVSNISEEKVKSMLYGIDVAIIHWPEKPSMDYWRMLRLISKLCFTCSYVKIIILTERQVATKRLFHGMQIQFPRPIDQVWLQGQIIDHLDTILTLVKRASIVCLK